MRQTIRVLALCCLMPTLSFSAGTPPKAELIGTLAIAKPAFLTLLDGSELGSKELIVSAFAVFGKSTVSRFTFKNESLKDLGQLKAQVITSAVNWPNDVTPVPKEIFGENFVAIGSGFLTPGNNTGGVSIAHVESSEVFKIAAPKKDYFYHRVLFADLNDDGRLDAIAARAKKPIFGASDGELIWLEQPMTGVKGIWQEHLITKGPDAEFALFDINSDGKPEIVSAEFFSKKLSLQWLENGIWFSRVLDAELGSAFDLEFADLNGDGNIDLLVSNHEGTAAASIFAYEIPNDFKTSTWPKHTLITAIKTEKTGKNQGSPGRAFAVQPSSKSALKKPWIIAGGDGSTKVHRLIAADDAADDWTYVEDIILDTDSTIGLISIGDVNGDGRSELFAPAYHEDKIYVFGL